MKEENDINETKNPISENRLGKFTIPEESLHDVETGRYEYSDFAKMFSSMVIVSCNRIGMGRYGDGKSYLEYIAFSPFFKKHYNYEGAEVPTYYPCVTVNDDGKIEKIEITGSITNG